MRLIPSKILNFCKHLLSKNLLNKNTVTQNISAEKDFLDTADIYFFLDEKNNLPIASAKITNTTIKNNIIEQTFYVNRQVVPFSRGEIIIYKKQAYKIDSFDINLQLFCLVHSVTKKKICLSIKDLHRLSKKNLKQFLIRNNKLILPKEPIKVKGKVVKNDLNKEYFVIEEVL